MASRFWVGGAGTWDAATTTNWAATSGGAGGQSVPGSGDTVTFDGSSGGGTVTVNFGGLITIQTLTMSDFTGTLDFATNDNSITLTGAAAFTSIGSATRTLNMGDGTWTLSSATALWNVAGSNFTLNANGSTIAFTGTATNQLRLIGGAKTYNIVTLAGVAGQNLIISGNNTIGTLTIGAPARVQFDNTQTITTLSTITGTATGAVILENSSPLFNASNSIVLTNAFTCSYCVIADLAFSGASATADNSFSVGSTSGITINAPSGGSSIIGVIGG